MLIILIILAILMPMSTPKGRKISEIRKTHIGRALFELERFYTRTSIDLIQKEGFPELTSGILSTLSQVDFESGTEMNTLIERLQTSKQAVSRMLKTCEELKFIKRVAHPSDGRAVIVVFDQKGIALMKTATRAIEKTEAEMSRQIGDQFFEDIKNSLLQATARMNLIKLRD